jgi:CRISPR/Cas system Type II protein with McrA/HNH and RuvC-like nuclease domain|tara:strand:- start:102 stop:296 length:195 start_codon:yes stop_codon:yes gene_type:complete
MKNTFMEYRVKKTILKALNEKLEDNKIKAIKIQNDPSSPINFYEEVLDNCKELEYAIKDMEKRI